MTFQRHNDSQREREMTQAQQRRKLVSRKTTTQKNVRLISPLTLVALAACKSDDVDVSPVESQSLSGVAMKGLLDNARVFVDLNGDGVFNEGLEPATFTNRDGEFTLSIEDRDAPVVVQSTTTTVDRSSDSVPIGLSMIGSTSGTVISPATTLLADGSLSKAELASSLGLSESIDVTTYNPFAEGVNPVDALQFESISHQLQNTIVSIQTALEVNGIESGQALKVAAESIADTVVQSASENKVVDFTDLSDVKTAVTNRVADLDIDDLDNVLEAAENVNKVISDKVQNGNVDDLSDIKNELSVSGLLAQQLNDAKSAETPSTEIELTNSGAALDAAANPAPTNIRLEGDTVVEEEGENQLVGTISAEDKDASGNDTSEELKFYLLPSAESAVFSLSEDGGLTAVETFNFEEKADYELTIRAVDESGRTVTDSVSVAVTNVNDAPTGSVEITGTAAVDETLTAVTDTLADEDGLGELSYQWKADGADISGATSATLTLSQDEVGKEIAVAVSYTDGGGTDETVTSAATAPVTNVNDAPTGSVEITGTAAEDETLTAVTDTLADEDGLGELSYQWKADGADISGATSATLTLSQDEVGKEIAVAVSYTDGGGTDETVTSDLTALIADLTTPDAAFDIELATTSGAVATFEVYATEAADSGGPGLDDVQFVLSHSTEDMTIDEASIVLADDFGLGVPNYDEPTGELNLAAIAIPPVTDLTTPILTFDATILNEDTPFNIAIDEVLVDDTAQPRVEEQVDFSAVTPAVEPLDSGAGSII